MQLPRVGIGDSNLEASSGAASDRVVVYIVASSVLSWARVVYRASDPIAGSSALVCPAFTEGGGGVGGSRQDGGNDRDADLHLDRFVVIGCW